MCAKITDLTDLLFCWYKQCYFLQRGGIINSNPDKNHFYAARVEHEGKPIHKINPHTSTWTGIIIFVVVIDYVAYLIILKYDLGKIVLHESGRAYKHGAELKDAYHSLQKIRVYLTKVLENPAFGMSN